MKTAQQFKKGVALPKLLLLTLVALCAVFFATKAEAAEVYSQELNPDETDLGFGYIDRDTDYDWSLTDERYINAVTVRLDRTAGDPSCYNQQFSMRIYKDGLLIGDSSLATETLREQGGTAIRFTFPSNTTVTMGNLRRIVIGSEGTQPTLAHWSSPCNDWDTEVSLEGDDTVTDPPFYNFSDTDFSPYLIIESNVAGHFVPPLTDGITTTDFKLWRYCFDPQGADFEEFAVKIQYGETLSEHEDDYTADTIEYWGDEERCFSIDKLTALTSGAKTARVNFYLDGNPYASSDIVDFNVVSGEQTMYPISLEPNSTTEPPPCTDGNIVVVGFCKTMRFLFVPDEDVTATFSETADEVKSKFPFAYITDVTDAVESVEEVSGDAAIVLTSDNEALPFTFSLLDKTEIEEFVGTGMVDIFRGLMIAVIGVSFGVYVFHRVGSLH